MDLHLQLQTMSNDGSTVKEYMFQLKVMMDHMCVIVETISNRNVVHYGLGGLDSDYNSFSGKIFIILLVCISKSLLLVQPSLINLVVLLMVHLGTFKTSYNTVYHSSPKSKIVHILWKFQEQERKW